MSDSQSSRFLSDKDAPIDSLIAYGISPRDVEGLQASGIYTCKAILQTKMHLTGVVRDAGLDTIRKVAGKLLKDWYPATGRDIILKGKGTADSLNEVIVKNLPYYYVDAQLKGQLKKHGKVVKVERVLENGLFKGSAKALFQSSEGARQALALNGTTFFGRELQLEIIGEEQNAELPFVVVKHLPRDISLQEVRAHFVKCGEPAKVDFTKVYQNKHRSAFIRYGSQQSIDTALELDGLSIREHQILVELGRADKSNRVTQGGHSGASSGPIRRLKDKSGRDKPY